MSGFSPRGMLAVNPSSILPLSASSKPSFMAQLSFRGLKPLAPSDATVFRSLSGVALLPCPLSGVEIFSGFSDARHTVIGMGPGYGIGGGGGKRMLPRAA